MLTLYRLLPRTTSRVVAAQEGVGDVGAGRREVAARLAAGELPRTPPDCARQFSYLFIPPSRAYHNLIDTFFLRWLKVQGPPLPSALKQETKRVRRVPPLGRPCASTSPASTLRDSATGADREARARGF